jgi:ATP-dependent Clp protease adaptor protein ClpS
MKTDLKDEVKQKENDTDSASLIVYNDDVNTFDHVIACLVGICGHSSHQAEQCAMIVHNSGKCKVKSGGLDEMIKMAERLIDNDLTVEVV